MSISSTTNRIDYTGNGATSVYSYGFKIFEDADLLVTVRDTDGNETTLALTTDYTVSGEGESSGGNVTLVNASQAWLDGDGDLLTNYILTIRRVVDLEQNTDIRNQGDYFPEVLEDALDYQLMIDQQQQDEIDRSVKLPETVDSDDFSASLPATISQSDSVGLALIVNANADGFSLGEVATVDVSSVPFHDVRYIDNADSPVTLTSDDRSKLIAVDTSAGNVVINLPAASGIAGSLSYTIAIKKTSSDANTITINPNGTDTIDGAASKVISVPNAAAIFVPDTEQSPDDWTTLDLGASSGGGAGGSPIVWMPGDSSPLELQEAGLEVLAFDHESSQEIFAHYKVPQGYTVGQQIKLIKGLFYIVATSGNIYMRAQAALVQPGSTAVPADFASYSDIHTSSNTEKTADAVSKEVNDLGDLDLCDSSGQINGQQVQVDDLIVIRLYRDIANESSSSADEANILRNSMEVQFS